MRGNRAKQGSILIILTALAFVGGALLGAVGGYGAAYISVAKQQYNKGFEAGTAKGHDDGFAEGVTTHARVDTPMQASTKPASGVVLQISSGKQYDKMYPVGDGTGAQVARPVQTVIYLVTPPQGVTLPDIYFIELVYHQLDAGTKIVEVPDAEVGKEFALDWPRKDTSYTLEFTALIRGPHGENLYNNEEPVQITIPAAK